MTDPIPPIPVDPDAALKAQKRRNAWLALGLVAFVIIVGVSTAVRISQNDFGGSDRLYFSGSMDEIEQDKKNRAAEARAATATDTETAEGASDDE